MSISFLLLFSLSILLYTTTDNIFTSLFATAIILPIYLVITYLQHKKIQRKNVFYPLGGTILALTATRRYNNSQPIMTPNIITTTYQDSTRYFFIGTAYIQSLTAPNKYTVRDPYNNIYTLSSKNTYQLGDTIYLHAYLTLPIITHTGNSRSDFFSYSFNYPKRLRMKGIAGGLFEQHSMLIAHQPDNRIDQTRNILFTHIEQTYGKSRVTGLIAGMLIGDKSQIPKSDYQDFIDSGMVHIIAVSGGNIVMLVIFLSRILFWIPLYPRIIIILTGIIAYAMLCGADSSVLRATIMGSLSLMSIIAGRGTSIRRMLAISYVTMLVYNPYFLAYDIGFVFSFSAIIGLILTQDWKLNPATFPRWIQNIRSSYILPTIGATLGVLPSLLFFIGTTNLLSIATNIIVIPFLPIILLYSISSILIYTIRDRRLISYVGKRIIEQIYIISHTTKLYGLYITIHKQVIQYLLLTTAIIYFIVYRYRHTKKQPKSLPKSDDVSILDDVFYSIK